MRQTPSQLNPVSLFGLSREELLCELAPLNFNDRQANVLLRQIYCQHIVDFEQIEGLSKSLCRDLAEHYHCTVPGQVQRLHASDDTVKFLFHFADGLSTEAVLIPSQGRRTLCISSQIGCALGCAFCATGKGGFKRDLSSAEMMAQIWQVEKYLSEHEHGARVSNVVMMGMGEPLLNFTELKKSLSLLRDAFAYDLPRRRVTVSTAGYVPGIYQLAKESDVALAVSLHASDDTLRSRLVPINKKYKLAELLQACRHYLQTSQNKSITFEYVMLAGVNDSAADAQALIALLKDFPAKINPKINLIPFNTFPGTDYSTSPAAVIEQFRRQLSDGGLITTVRRPRGSDIEAACGQLVFATGKERGMLYNASL